MQILNQNMTTEVAVLLMTGNSIHVNLVTIINFVLPSRNVKLSCTAYSIAQLVSLSTTATTALIYPKEVDTTTCDAMCCNIKDLKGKDIDWVQCDGCDKWLHAYCIGISIEMIEKMEKFYCQNCEDLQ